MAGEGMEVEWREEDEDLPDDEDEVASEEVPSERYVDRRSRMRDAAGNRLNPCES